MDKIRVVFLATPDFTVDILKALYGSSVVDLKYVFTKNNEIRKRGKIIKKSALVDFCKKHQISYCDRGVIDNEHKKILHDLNVDVGLMVAYGVLLKPDFFNIPKWGIHNLHFSCLPYYRGASPIQSAILNGDEVSGITLQKIEKGLDTGDILFQKSFSIIDKRVDEVFQMSIDLSLIMIEEWISRLGNGSIESRQQNSEKATYCYKFIKDSGFIAKDDDILMAIRKYRAFYIWPKTYFKINGIKYDIHEIGDMKEGVYDFKGVLNKENKQLFLYLRGGCLEIKKIKMEGKKVLSTFDFLNGSSIQFPANLD